MPEHRLAKPVPGIRAIAKALDVSVATVHRALHNQGRVSLATRERVLRMAQELQYRPNLAARDLRLNRHFRISIHFPDTIAAFFDLVRKGIEEGAEQFRSVLDLEFHYYSRGAGRAQASFCAGLESKAHGIIAVPANTARMKHLVEEANQRKVPVIFVSTDAPDSGRLTAVTPHPYYSGCMAAEVLAGSMKRKSRGMVIAGDLKNLNQTEKVRGFRATLARSRSALPPVVIETLDSPELAHTYTLQCLQQTPDIGAVYVTTANSISALQALRLAHRLHTIPVVTTDLFAELIPYLSDGAVKATIYQCPELQGSLAIRAMYQYLMDGKAAPESIGVIPQLVMKSNLDLYLHNSPLAAG
jgi:LacI family transcriptional regulator, galactose operon repressor